jgi:hypothetical protein
MRYDYLIRWPLNDTVSISRCPLRLQKQLFFPTIPYNSKSTTLRLQALPPCPFHKSGIKIKMLVQHWWDILTEENRSTRRKNLSQQDLSQSALHIKIYLHYYLTQKERSFSRNTSRCMLCMKTIAV